MEEVKVVTAQLARAVSPPQLNPSRMVGSEFARTIWVATVEHGTTREQFLQPGFWSMNAARLKPYDHIEVRCDDGTFWAELLVLACDRTWARVRELRFVSLTTAEVSQTQAMPEAAIQFEVRYRGPHAKWGIVRLSDAAVIKDGIAQKVDAERELRDYISTIMA